MDGFTSGVAYFLVGIYILTAVLAFVCLCINFVTDGDSNLGIEPDLEVLLSLLIVVIPVTFTSLWAVLCVPYILIGSVYFVFVGGCFLLYGVLWSLRGLCRLTKKLDTHKEDKAAHGH